MIKTFKSERGGMMLLVVGVILMAFILIVPLTMTTSTGQRQSIMDTQYEKAHTKAESVALVFQRMLIEDQADIKGVEDIHEWASRLQGMNLCKDSSVVYNESAALVTVKCTEGSGKVSKTSPVQFQLKYALDNGGSAGGPGAVGGDKFYNKFPVVAKNIDKSDKVYCTPPSVELAAKYISKDYDFAKYSEEFNELLHTFTQDNFVKKITAPIFPTVIEPDFPTGAAKGNYTYSSSVAGYPTITGSLLRDGNITINIDSGKTVRINGDLIASGSITVYLGSTSSKLVVTGKVHADSIKFSNSSSPLISVGQWDSEDWNTGKVINSDKSSLVVRNGITFEQSQNLRVAGNVNAGNMNANSSVTLKMKVGGNLTTSGDMTLGIVNPLIIVGTVTVGGKLTFLNTADDIQIGGSLLVKQNVNFKSTLGNRSDKGLNVQGSVYINGDLILDNESVFIISGDLITTGAFTAQNFIYKMNIRGSWLTAGNIWFNVNGTNIDVGKDVITTGTFFAKNVVNNMKIGGSLVAAGDLTFNNDSKNIQIGGMVLSGGTISFKTVDNLQVVGILAASQNIKMSNHLNPFANFGGFYAGGNVNIVSWINDCSIIIDHDPPPAQSAGESVFRIVFGSWKAGN